MRPIHIAFMYLVGGLMLVLIKEAHADCITQVTKEYPAMIKADGIKVLRKPYLDTRLTDYCNCIYTTMYSKPALDTLDINKCKAYSRLYEVIVI